MKIIVLSMSLLSCTLAWSGTKESEQDKRHAGPGAHCWGGSQADNWECFEKVEQEVDKKFKLEISHFDLALKQWDEDFRFIKEARRSLQRFESRIIDYANAKADFASALSGGSAGNSNRIAQLQARIAVKIAVTHDLVDLRKGLRQKVLTTSPAGKNQGALLKKKTPNTH